MMKRPLILATCAMFATFSPLQAQDVSSETLIAKVNGVEITLGHMIVLRDTLPDQYRNLPDDVLFDGLRQQLIQQQLLASAFDGLEKAIELRLANEERSLKASAQIDILLGEQITDEALNELYNNKYADFEGEPEFDASHILVETEEEAIALIAELEAGAEFGALAIEHSTGPSGPREGKLGWFGKGQMVPPFELAVVEMEVGEISAPVQTQFGWHVIRLNDSRVSTPPDLPLVADDLREELSQTILASVLSGLQAAADIEEADLSSMDPSVLSDTSLVTE